MKPPPAMSARWSSRHSGTWPGVWPGIFNPPKKIPNFQPKPTRATTAPRQAADPGDLTAYSAAPDARNRHRNRPPDGRMHRAGGRARAHRRGQSRLSDRRLGLYLPRLSRAAAPDTALRRTAGRRRLRLLQHALEAARRQQDLRPADTHRGRLRYGARHLPDGHLRGLQDEPA